jgi:hypothetical protein
MSRDRYDPSFMRAGKKRGRGAPITDSSVSSCVIFGWVTKVPLPLVISTRPRSTKF